MLHPWRGRTATEFRTTTRASVPLAAAVGLDVATVFGRNAQNREHARVIVVALDGRDIIGIPPWTGMTAKDTPDRAAAIVYVIDDDASLRAGLDGLFRSVGLACRTYDSARAFLAAEPADAPGCIVVDVRLPGMSGLDFQEHLAQQGVRLPIVLMTGHGDIPMSVRAMKAGAVDFLPKPFRDQDMLDAVGTAIDRDRARRTADGDVSQVRDRFATLSAREREVMLLVTAGKLNKQVAGDLGISEITVKIHRGAAMRKMGARSLVELVRMAELVKPKTSDR